MSVLSAIKGTIVSVKQDISQSLNNLTSSNDDQRSNRSTVNSSSGAELLYRYSNCWRDIHEGSEDLAHRSQAVDVLISNLFQSLEKQNNAMNHFLSELSSVTFLSTAITVVKNRIGSLERGCSQLETLLMELEDVCDEQEALVKRRYHETQLKQYRLRKHEELEQVKVSLAAKHSKKVLELEAQINATLVERQNVFHVAHMEQMENYKQSRHVPSVPLAAGLDKTISERNLEDINVDDGVEELEKFLEDIDVDDAVTPVGAQEINEITSKMNIISDIESMKQSSPAENSLTHMERSRVKGFVYEDAVEWSENVPVQHSLNEEEKTKVTELMTTITEPVHQDTSLKSPDLITNDNSRVAEAGRCSNFDIQDSVSTKIDIQTNNIIEPKMFDTTLSSNFDNLSGSKGSSDQ